MDTKVNFAKIGFFVVMLFALLLAFIFWLGKYGFKSKEYDYYTIYFTESISGLNLESPIKYKGFEVGSVKDISINAKNSEQIEVLVAIDEGTPIKKDNFAMLGIVGITGLKYIELKGGSQNSALLEADKDNRKIIYSKQSMIESLELSTKDFKDILVQTKKLLSNENIQTLSELFKNSSNSFKNIEHFSANLIAKDRQIDMLIEKFSDFAQKSVDSFSIMSDSATTVKSSAASFEQLSKEFLKQLQNGSFDFKDISKESLQKLNLLLQRLDYTLIQTQDFIEELEKSPSDIIFKKQAIEYGPGE